MTTTVIKGTTYDLATTLRVAYTVQGMHNHKPYTEVFKNLGDMTIEQQVGILYAAFKVANPEVAKTISEIDFLNYYLDNYTLKAVMDQLQAVVQGILGKTDGETPEGDKEGN